MASNFSSQGSGGSVLAQLGAAFTNLTGRAYLKAILGLVWKRYQNQNHES